VVVFTVLIGCVGFLAWRWAQPQPASIDAVALTVVEPRPATVAAPAPEVKSPVVEVLLHPGQIFKCELRGRVTFSEKPCTDGATQTVQPANARASSVAPSN
jgi:hypothetical protein